MLKLILFLYVVINIARNGADQDKEEPLQPDSDEQVKQAWETKLDTILNQLSESQQKEYSELNEASRQLRQNSFEAGLSLFEARNGNLESSYIPVQMLINGKSLAQIESLLQSICPELYRKTYAVFGDTLSSEPNRKWFADHDDHQQVCAIDELNTIDLCTNYLVAGKLIDYDYNLLATIVASDKTWTSDILASYRRVFPDTQQPSSNSAAFGGIEYRVDSAGNELKSVAEITTTIDGIYEGLKTKTIELKTLIDARNISGERCGLKQLLEMKARILAYKGSNYAIEYLRHFYDRQVDLCNELERLEAAKNNTEPLITEELTLVVQTNQ